MLALRRVVHEVRSVEIGVVTHYEQHQLVVGRDQVEALFADPALASVRAHVAVPGDRVRIVAPLDVVEPRPRDQEARRRDISRLDGTGQPQAWR